MAANDSERKSGSHTGRPRSAPADQPSSSVLSKPGKVRAGDAGSESDSTDFSVDSVGFESSDVDDSRFPLILDGNAASTNLSDADPSLGTVSEAIEAKGVTVDLPEQAIESADQDADGTAPQPSTTRTGAFAQAPPFRPTRRPPMAVLRVYDDGLENYGEVRVRKTPFDIGRLDGDLVIPHELQMSRRHARIERTQLKTDPTTAERSLAEWTLKDLRSLNGTFLRKTQLSIHDRDEAILGGDLVRFLLPEENDSLVLVKVGAGKEDQRLTVQPGTAWIGSDASTCLPFLQGNTFLDGRQLRLESGRRGRWTLTDEGSTNGVWVRIDSAPLQDGAEWQCGEQRFAFVLP